ncbi:hypothetical protein I7I53_10900 [Histoplasma capsulatum var. duboisii H88]|uniref:Uncharacterized protein n=1 Tax=Ajellomyces capsulatus (strain H88) TaxID=544711 RepID=A0A8A1L9G8_AJEC8|nr:hypothetical protein I7I53_10900 [Histoplasma capsulatum var. duboisii H88]
MLASCGHTKTFKLTERFSNMEATRCLHYHHLHCLLQIQDFPIHGISSKPRLQHILQFIIQRQDNTVQHFIKFFRY